MDSIGSTVPIFSEPPAKPSDRLLSYQISNLQGVGCRQRQEDSLTIMNAFDVIAIKEKGLFFAVCDGMGGMKDGKLASETAIASLRQSFQSLDYSADLATQLVKSVYEASARVESIIGGDGGSTVVTGILYQGKLYYASVGDSYFYLLRGGHLYRINAEHNLTQDRFLDAIRDDDFDPDNYRDLPEATALTEFLGMIGIDRVDAFVKPLNMYDGDILLACSDGVGGVLSEEELTESLSLSDVNDMSRSIENKIVARQKPHQDNFTGVVVKCIL